MQGKDTADKDRDSHKIGASEQKKQASGAAATGDLDQGVVCIGPYDPRKPDQVVDVSILK